jgi:glycyl-tRNA synthetase beta chain
MRIDNLLVEIGTEELPPKSLSKLASSFADSFAAELQEADLKYQEINWYATPRRLALMVTKLAGQQDDKIVEKRGPAVSAAFDSNGDATKAAQGWARSNGIEVQQAQRLVTDKGEWLLYKANVPGKQIEALLSSMIEKSLKKLPIPKPMRWGSKTTQFIRPVHSLTVLFGSQLVDAEVLGLTSSRDVFGHRFHGQQQFELTSANDYVSALKEQYVMADFAARKQAILEGLHNAAKKEDAVADIDEALLDEVTALVEWPVIMTASFDESFLQVPKEALIYTMKDDQKYFPLLDSDRQLKSRFLFVSNIESKQPDQVIGGNERVIRPRLADARFFFETDKKHTLSSRLDSLDSVLFQKQLGTLKEKSVRIAELAKAIAIKIGANADHAHRAGLLSKTDLMTNMVMEFPDVQGVMGMHYAREDGEPEEVAIALDEQYKPRYSGDSLPSSNVSCAIALADKLDTLVGIFGIGQIPKGDKDPFALRRAAIGVLRIIVDNQLDLDLEDLVSSSRALFADKLSNESVQQQVVDFVLARFRTWYQEQGVDVDVIQAVLAKRPTRPADFAARVTGVAHFKSLDSAIALAAANKRVANILDKNKVSGADQVVTSLLVEQQEKDLAARLLRVEERIKPLLLNGDYATVLSQLSELRDSIDAFFDNVMVMAEDEKVRANRLALLLQLRKLFLHTADISVLTN